MGGRVHGTSQVLLQCPVSGPSAQLTHSIDLCVERTFIQAIPKAAWLGSKEGTIVGEHRSLGLGFKSWFSGLQGQRHWVIITESSCAK